MSLDAENMRRVKWVYSEPICVFAAVLLVTYLAYFLDFAPALYSADWFHIVWGNWTDTWLDFDFPWPLFKTPFFIQDRIFDLEITPYYLLLVALQIAQAASLYFIIRLITSSFDLLHGGAFSLVATLLFLIYPIVYTRMWLTMIFFYVPILLALLHGYTLLKYASTGQVVYLVMAILLLVISLGIYEAQIGIVCAWALILFVVYRDIELGRRLILLLPMILVGLFVIWRTIAFEDEGGKYSFLNEIARTPSGFLSHLITGYQVSLGYGWITTIEHYLPWIPRTRYIALLAVGGILITWLSIRLWFGVVRHRLSGHRREAEKRPWPLDQRWPSIRSYLFSSFAGLFLIAAGYVPIILKFGANLGGSTTRFNFPATIGSSVFFASVLMIGAIIFVRNKHNVKHVFLAAAIPFVLLGILTQNLVQGNAKIAWEEQKSIYNKLFSVAPDFEDHTTIVLVLRGYRDRIGRWDHWRRVPIGSAWAASSAIQLFYDNPTLSSYVIYPDLAGQPLSALNLRGIVSPVPSVEQSNVIRMRFDAFTPYAQSVFFEYDSETSSLRPLDELPAKFVEGASGPIRLKTDRIVSAGASNVGWRRLVAE